MEKIEVYWGKDQDFEEATKSLKHKTYLSDVLDHISKKEVKIEGVPETEELPMKVENFLIHTDDYGGMEEWALLGFSNNVLCHLKLEIKKLWLCNPPQKIYKDIVKNFDKKIIKTHETSYSEITVESMKKMADGFNEAVIGQPHVIKHVLTSIYGLKNPKRTRPVTLLFLGLSGVGKTETAKYISESLETEMVRIQFSMQQTNNAYQYIFGADHGEDSLARELIRRKSNVILLDEFDKVPSTFYNAFYQMFDEGIFVDSNYSVDVSKCIIICTSNYQTEEEAEKYLGTPIYSRFSKVISFKPITIDNKLKIAEKCYESIMSQIDEEDKTLIEENSILPFFNKAIENGSYPNMRMLKNDIEDAVNFEILKARKILSE